MRKGVIIAIVLTWLVVSYMPSLSAASLLGKRKG